MSKEDFRVLVNQAMDRRGIRTKKEIAVLAELGGVRVDESGVWMRYDVGISDFVPVPFVASIG